MFVTKLAAVLNEMKSETPTDVLRVQEQVPLQPLDRVEQEDEEEAEAEQMGGVLLPRLLLRGLVADRAEEAALGAAEEAEAAAREEAVVVGEDARHVGAERVARGDEDRDEDEDLGDALAHQNFSPRKRA